MTCLLYTPPLCQACSKTTISETAYLWQLNKAELLQVVASHKVKIGPEIESSKGAGEYITGSAFLEPTQKGKAIKKEAAVA